MFQNAFTHVRSAWETTLIMIALAAPVAIALALGPRLPTAFLTQPASEPISGAAAPVPTAAAVLATPAVAQLATAPSAEAPAAAAPAAAEVPTPQALAQPKVLLDQSLADAPAGWQVAPDGITSLAPGGYLLRAVVPSQFVAVQVPDVAPLQDVRVTAQFAKVGGPPGGGYGLIVRDQTAPPLDGVQQQGNYLVFEAGDRAEFGIWRRTGSRWDDLIGWRHTDAIHPGTLPNELTVEALGPRLSFTINGITVATLEDASPVPGNVGVFLGGDFNQGVLQHLRVEALH